MVVSFSLEGGESFRLNNKTKSKTIMASLIMYSDSIDFRRERLRISQTFIEEFCENFDENPTK